MRFRIDKTGFWFWFIETRNLYFRKEHFVAGNPSALSLFSSEELRKFYFEEERIICTRTGLFISIRTFIGSKIYTYEKKINEELIYSILYVMIIM